jgi:hypothetical protein
MKVLMMANLFGDPVFRMVRSRALMLPCAGTPPS